MASNADRKGEDNAGCEGGVCVPRWAKAPSDSAHEAKSFADEPNTSVRHIPSKTSIKIEVISDTMCPWCPVGKRGLDEALRHSPGIQAEVSWKPFFLAKNIPEEGRSADDYFEKNYGDSSVRHKMMPSLINAGKRSGIDFETHYTKMERYYPTIRSHRLIELAKHQNKEDAMVEELFHMHFEKGKRLNSIKDLVDSANKVGLSGDIEAFLKGTEYHDEVLYEAASIQHLAHGVPTFLFTLENQPNMKPISFSGGQPPEAFIRVFEHLQKADKAES